VNWNLILQNALLFGAIISVVMTLGIVIGFRINPEFLLHDAPPKIRERYGPVRDEPKRRRQATWFSIPLFGSLLFILIYAVVRLDQLDTQSASNFLALFVTFFVAMQIFNLFDLLVLDWLIVATLKPKFLLIPGTEDWEGYDDYGFYFQGFLKGFVGITIASLIFAGLAFVIVKLIA